MEMKLNTNELAVITTCATGVSHIKGKGHSSQSPESDVMHEGLSVYQSQQRFLTELVCTRECEMDGGMQTPSHSKRHKQKRADHQLCCRYLMCTSSRGFASCYHLACRNARHSNTKITQCILTHDMKCGWCITQQSQKASASDEFAPAWA